MNISGGLESELAAAGDAWDAARALFDLGADRGAVLSWPLFGAVGTAIVAPDGDGLYRPAEVGTRAILIGVRDDRDGELIDILALAPAQPARWRRRTGIAGFLGREAVLRAAFMGEPLDLHATPLDWLRASGRGAVVLDLTISLRLHFAGIPEIRAATLELGRVIDKRLRSEPVLRAPRVLIPNQARAA